MFNGENLKNRGSHGKSTQRENPGSKGRRRKSGGGGVVGSKGGKGRKRGGGAKPIEVAKQPSETSAPYTTKFLREGGGIGREAWEDQRKEDQSCGGVRERCSARGRSEDFRNTKKD